MDLGKPRLAFFIHKDHQVVIEDVETGPGAEKPWPEREARLLQRLSEEPFLFVLDGLERVLIAYNRMDASKLADDEFD